MRRNYNNYHAAKYESAKVDDRVKEARKFLYKYVATESIPIRALHLFFMRSNFISKLRAFQLR